MGWIDKQSGDTAATLKARLDAAGYCVHISEETGSTIAYHNGSSPLKQSQTVKVDEYRGLTEDAATLLVGLTDDQTTITVYYSQRASTTGTTAAAQYCACAVRTGSLKTVVASRKSEGGDWFVLVTETTFAAAGSGWTSTRPTASQTGVVVSNLKRGITHIYGDGVGSVFQTVTTTVTEYQFCTQAEATALCVCGNSTVTNYVTYTDHSGNSCKYYYTTGTVTSSVMRYIDEAYGWTVTKTVETTV